MFRFEDGLGFGNGCGVWRTIAVHSESVIALVLAETNPSTKGGMVFGRFWTGNVMN